MLNNIIVSPLRKTVSTNGISDRKPQPLPVIADNIPDQIKQHKSWCCWKYKFINERWTKVPLTPNGNFAATNRTSTWNTFDFCLQTYKRKSRVGGIDGIGYFLLGGEICGIDIDHVVTNGVIDPEFQEVVHSLSSYTELSPSGEGLRILTIGKLPEKDRRAGCVEMYDGSKGRFLTITGQTLGSSKVIEHRQAEITTLHAKYLKRHEKPEKVIKEKQVHVSSNVSVEVPDVPSGVTLDDVLALAGPKFHKLWNGNWSGQYGSQSEADLALCGMLAYFVNDSMFIDDAFRESGLYREKWEREDYREWTIGRATLTTDQYDWSGWYSDAVISETVSEWGESQMDTFDFSSRLSSFLEVADDLVSFDGGEYQPKPKPAVSSPVKGNETATFAIRERVHNQRPEWLVDQIFRRNSVCVIFGASGCRKTWLAIDLAMSVSTGTPFLDQFKVKQGKVFYIISEGADDFELRSIAWSENKDIDTPSIDEFAYRPGFYDFNQDGSVDAVIAHIQERLGEADMIIVDTLSKNFIGDSDKNESMAMFLSRMEELREKTGATIVVIHHSGWGNTHRERGGSSLRCGVDTSVLVEKDGEKSTLYCSKQKMGQEFVKFSVKFDMVHLPEFDTEEEKVTALVGHYHDDTEEKQDALQKLITESFAVKETWGQMELVKSIQNAWKGKPPGRDRLCRQVDALCGEMLVKESKAGGFKYKLL